MAAFQNVYRCGKRLMEALPAWLFRFRPFRVYEIVLTNATDTMPSERSPSNAPSATPNYEIRWILDAAEAAELRSVASAATISDCNFTTRRAVGVWLDGRVIACAWLARGTFKEIELGLMFELQPNETWLYAAMVDPAHRRQGVYRQLLDFISRELKNDVERILLGVTFGNERSTRAHARQGSTELGTIICARSLGLTICFLRGRVRRLPQLSRNWREPVRLEVLSRLRHSSVR